MSTPAFVRISRFISLDRHTIASLPYCLQRISVFKVHSRSVIRPIGCAFRGLLCSTFDCMVTHRIAYVNTYFDIFSRSLFCTIQAACFCVLSTIGFSSCFLLFMRVNYRLAILSFVLRAFRAATIVFMRVVACLYDLILKLIVGAYTGFIRNIGF